LNPIVFGSIVEKMEEGFELKKIFYELLREIIDFDLKILYKEEEYSIVKRKMETEGCNYGLLNKESSSDEKSFRKSVSRSLGNESYELEKKFRNPEIINKIFDKEIHLLPGIDSSVQLIINYLFKRTNFDKKNIYKILFLSTERNEESRKSILKNNQGIKREFLVPFMEMKYIARQVMNLVNVIEIIFDCEYNFYLDFGLLNSLLAFELVGDDLSIFDNSKIYSREMEKNLIFLRKLKRVLDEETKRKIDCFCEVFK